MSALMLYDVENIHFNNPLLQLLAAKNAAVDSDWQVEALAIDEQAAKKILTTCNNADMALYVFLLALYNCVNHKYAREDRVSVACPTTQSNNAQSNFVLLENEVLNDNAVKSVVLSVKESLVTAYSDKNGYFAAGQDGDKLMADNVLLALDNIHGPSSCQGQFPLSIHFQKGEGTLTGHIAFHGGLFSSALVSSFGRSLSEYINNACNDFTQQVTTVNMLSTAEFDKVIGFADGAQSDVPQCSIVQLFEQAAEQHLDATALSIDGETVSYETLKRNADAAASALIDQGVTSGDTVALVFSHSVEMVTAILAVLKAGATFVPLAPDDAKARIDYIVADAKAKLVLTNQDVEIDGYQAVHFSQLQSKDNSQALPKSSSDATAYVIYTSGTTGQPKGVAVAHSNIVNSSLWNVKEFGLSVDDSFLLLFPYNFDGAVLDIFSALVSGCNLVLVNAEQSKSTDYIADVIESQQISQLKTVPALYKSLLNSDAHSGLQSLKRVGLAGDFIDAETIETSRKTNDSIRLTNLYDPTENTVVSTYYNDITVARLNVIGRPIANVSAFILDDDKNEVPVGGFGELYLSGSGVAKGYINKAELTSQKFTEVQGHRAYQTGDLARWMPDGNIEIKGRVDNQIKLRGFRIELDGIKSVLLSHPVVSEALAVTLGEGDALAIHAVIATTNELAKTDLDTHLAQHLPEYMKPTSILELAAIPKLASGKYDINAVKEQIAESMKSAVKTEPTTPTEQQLLAIFKEVLVVEQIGTNESFFSLGGHSLKANILLSKIHKAFGVNLSLRTVFVANTVQTIAVEIERNLPQNSQQTQSQETARTQKEVAFFDAELAQDMKDYNDEIDDAKLSLTQMRLWYVNQFIEQKGVYNVPVTLKIDGHINQQALQFALDEIVKRHEILHTVYQECDEKQAMQQLLPAKPVEILTFDFCALEDNEFMVNEILSQQALRSFDLAKDLMLRAVLINVSAQSQVLSFTIHHIAFDGLSKDILLDELSRLYQSFVKGEANPLKPLSVQFKHFTYWQTQRFSGERLQRLTTFWRNELDQMPSVHSIPLDFDRPEVPSHKGYRYTYRLSEALTDDIRGYAIEHKVSLFMLLHATFAVLLSSWSKQQDIVIGTPVSGRSMDSFNPVIGYFANMVVLRNQVSQQDKFADFLAQNKEMVLKIFEHQEMPFDLLVKQINPQRILGVNPLFQVSFSMVNSDSDSFKFADTNARFMHVGFPIAKFDLSLYVADKGDFLEVMWESSCDLFKDETINNAAQNYEDLLGAIVSEQAHEISQLMSFTK